MKRPVGVTILAVIGIIYGIISLLLALLGLIGLGLLAGGVATRSVPYSAGTLIYATIGDAVLGILYLVFGIGAFRLKGWAWTAGVVALVLDIVRNLVGFVIQGSARSLVVPIITIVIALLLLGYLFRQNVRAAFGKAAVGSIQR